MFSFIGYVKIFSFTRLYERCASVIIPFLYVAIFFLLGQASRRSETSRDVCARESALQLRQAGFQFPIYLDLHGNFPSWILKFSEMNL